MTPMLNRAHDIAACLGLDEATVRKLQARGYLRRFELSEAEVRERLYQAHRRYLLRRAVQRILPGLSDVSHAGSRVSRYRSRQHVEQ